MPHKFDQEYWLGLAEEMRAVAGQMSNHRDSKNMLGVTESYLWLANQIDEQAETLAEMSKPKAQQKGIQRFESSPRIELGRFLNFVANW